LSLSAIRPLVEISQLSDIQLSAFDQEYVNAPRWAAIQACIEQDFPGRRFSFVDVGGGNGLFADRVLGTYPEVTGTVLDSSELLLSKNAPSIRKKVICANLNELSKYCPKVDIIFCHWVLHHLVRTGSYGTTRGNIALAVALMRQMLTAHGRISVFENNYNGYIDALPGRLVFMLSSSHILVPILKQLSVNTAGVGVCFLSRREWTRVFKENGLQVLDYYASPDWHLPMYHKMALLIRSVEDAHYWLAPSQNPSRQDLSS
jgi:O-methyltransferase